MSMCLIGYQVVKKLKDEFIEPYSTVMGKYSMVMWMDDL